MSTFNPKDHLTKIGANFECMKNNENFYFPNLVALYEYISKLKSSNDYCFVEVRTQYFKLFFDLDSDNDNGFLNMNNYQDFWLYIISKIIISLKQYVKNKDENKFLYIYSDREDKINKLHLYFPNIIIDDLDGLAIRRLIIKQIKADNKYKLKDVFLEALIDSAVYKKCGIRILFQPKPNESGYYKINVEKSTLTNIPTDKIEQLKLTSIRTNARQKNILNNDCGIYYKVNYIRGVKNIIEIDENSKIM